MLSSEVKGKVRDHIAPTLATVSLCHGPRGQKIYSSSAYIKLRLPYSEHLDIHRFAKSLLEAAAQATLILVDVVRKGNLRGIR
jgi:hypothetical protein